jgi:hypothetical protein
VVEVTARLAFEAWQAAAPELGFPTFSEVWCWLAEDNRAQPRARGDTVKDSNPPREPLPEPMLRWFAFSHLPTPELRAVSEPFFTLAWSLVRTLPPSAERTVALRKLLESKDAAVRAALPEVVSKE